MINTINLAAACAVLVLIPAAVLADDQSIDEVHVWGRATQQVGTAYNAGEGTVGYADFELRPMLRSGEFVELIPGMIATQHSGTGKANQYFLRGFNLDHGTDFAGFVDGVPVNMRTHGHGQGYLDLNFLIPELVERLDYQKGLYDARNGDFAVAGAARMHSANDLESNIAKIEVGSFDAYRGFAALQNNDGDANWLFAIDGQINEGPWVLDEDLKSIKAYLARTQAVGNGRATLRAMAYDSSWQSTDQVPLRAIRSGQIPANGFIDPDLGGDTSRYSLSAIYNDQTYSASAYAIFYELSLFSNFTYFLDDPVNGDQFEQVDKRVILGGQIERTTQLKSRPDSELTFGADIRYDHIYELGLHKTVARQRINRVRDDQVEELSISAHAQLTTQLTDQIRARVGARLDYVSFDVDAALIQNSGSGDDLLLSPNLSLTYQPYEHLEFYASYGRGFHSNDVRGATISIDPQTLTPVSAVDALVGAEGADIGFRLQADNKVNFAVTLFWLELDSELVFVGDAGTTEPNDKTRRFGGEADLFWKPVSWLTLDASAGLTHARFKDVAAGQDRIPNSIERVVGAGITLTNDNGASASLRVRHFGPAPLIEDNSVRSDGTTIVNAGVIYPFGQSELRLDVLNLLDSDDADITYFFDSQLAGEAAPVSDIHLHPVIERTFRLSYGIRF